MVDPATRALANRWLSGNTVVEVAMSYRSSLDRFRRAGLEHGIKIAFGADNSPVKCDF